MGLYPYIHAGDRCHSQRGKLIKPVQFWLFLDKQELVFSNDRLS
ncbi:hypothetical protein PLG01_01256 [Streptococcus mutans PKUSS-LG01]|nr:hypothetical protein PLG01_01256 [Streptococcus mutans PKUSS-LG01]